MKTEVELSTTKCLLPPAKPLACELAKTTHLFPNRDHTVQFYSKLSNSAKDPITKPAPFETVDLDRGQKRPRPPCPVVTCGVHSPGQPPVAIKQQSTQETTHQ